MSHTTDTTPTLEGLHISRELTIDGQLFTVLLDEEAPDCTSVSVFAGTVEHSDEWEEQCYDTLSDAQRAYDAITEAQLREWAEGGFRDFKHFLDAPYCE
jgi:hypothetical protein